MKAYWMMTRAGLRAFKRDRQALIWTLFFPIFFIMIFGLIGGGRGSGAKFPIGIVALDKSPSGSFPLEVFRKVPVFDVKTGSEESEKRELQKGTRRVVVVFPADLGEKFQSGEPAKIQVYYDPTQQISQTVVGIVRQVIAGIEQNMSGRPALLAAQEVPLLPGADQRREPRTIDFMVPGILAMSIMQLGLFTAIPIINMREKGILKRLRATPLPRSALVGSQITQRLVIALFQTGTIIGLGSLVFKFHAAGSWLAVLGLVVLGVLTFISIGAVLSALARTQESGISMVQLVNIPMMFLSGIFFPPEMLPSFMKPITAALPATYLADALRFVMLNAPSAHSISIDILILGAWLTGGLFVSMRTFRWE